jgi:hypothetical protein
MLTQEFIPHRTTNFPKKHHVPKVLVPDPYGMALCMIY